MINSKTSFLALIGNPVDHSLSPIMQNAVLEHLKMDLVYLALPCKDEDFEMVINTLKKINCKGLNITIPFKEKAFKLCDEITPIARKVKAINTLKLNSNGEWIGTNTDIEGFMHPLKNIDLKQKKSTVLGSGGAARSVIKGLINLNLSEIVIISRNQETKANIINDFKDEINIKTLNSDDENVSEQISSSDLIVNTTPVGMNKLINAKYKFPFGINFWEPLTSKTIVYDLIYNPRPTELLKLSFDKGCKIIDGSEMLIAQGAKSLEFWTDGLNIPIEIMKDSLKKYL